MRRAKSLEDLLRQPAESYLQGESFLVWRWRTPIAGTIMRAQPSGDELEFIFRMWDLIGPEIAIITDVRAWSRPSADLFARVLAYGKRRASELASIRHALLVEPGDQASAVALGIVALVGTEWRVFHDLPSALAWITPDQVDAAAAARAIGTLIAERGDEAPLLTALRQHLRAELRTATIARIARVMQRSERALQRALEEAGTSFRAELAAQRIEAACELLATTDETIAAIARQVGFVSAAGFTQQFRRTTGQTPTAYRNAKR